jgi:hypothetical protein
MKEKLADLPLGRLGGPREEGFGPFGNLDLSDITAGPRAFTQIISNIIGVITIIAGIWFVFMFIIAGFSFLTAGGDSKKMGEATAKLTSALIGLIVVVSAYAIISLIGALLGFDILNPQDIIERLGPGV